MRVLLVDDEQSILRALSRILADLQHDVVCAMDGSEALAFLRSEEIDVVVSDIRMPRTDGLVLTETMRAEGLDVPVILISGHGDEAFEERALRIGATSYLHKPVRLRDLLQALETAVQRPPQQS